MTMLDLAARFVHVGKVRGAYLEFGVYRGFTFSSAYKSFRRHNSSISHMWAFDSFDGMPAPTGVDQGAGSFEQAGQFRCSAEEFVRQLDGYRVPRSDYAVIPGWFDETLTADLAKEGRTRSRRMGRLRSVQFDGPGASLYRAAHSERDSPRLR